MRSNMDMVLQYIRYYADHEKYGRRRMYTVKGICCIFGPPSGQVRNSELSPLDGERCTDILDLFCDDLRKTFVKLEAKKI